MILIIRLLRCNKEGSSMLYKVITINNRKEKVFTDNTCNGVIFNFYDNFLKFWGLSYEIYEYRNKQWMLIGYNNAI